MAQERGLSCETSTHWGYLNPLGILALARFFRKHRIQIIHAHWSRDLSNLIPASALSGRPPIVLHKHVAATEPKRDIFHDWIYRHTDRIIAISELVRKNLLSTVRTSPGKVTLIYNGLDLNGEWSLERVRQQEINPALGLGAQDRILGFVGRLNPGKGVAGVITAFLKLAPDFPDWRLVLVGRAVGSEEERFVQEWREILDARGLATRVHWLGYREDVPALMRAFSILVCASKNESFGLVAAEGMAMECAVLASRSGAFPEIISPGMDGELFDPGDWADLTEKLRGLMGDQERRRGLGTAGRLTVLRRFSLEKTTAHLLEVFQQELADQRKRRTTWKPWKR